MHFLPAWRISTCHSSAAPPPPSFSSATSSDQPPYSTPRTVVLNTFRTLVEPRAGPTKAAEREPGYTYCWRVHEEGRATHGKGYTRAKEGGGKHALAHLVGAIRRFSLCEIVTSTSLGVRQPTVFRKKNRVPTKVRQRYEDDGHPTILRHGSGLVAAKNLFQVVSIVYLQ